MQHKIASATLAALFVASFALAAETKEATGTVKTVSGKSLTVTDSAAKDWTFEIDKETVVVAKGGSHKMDQLTKEGKPTTLSEFVAEKQTVTVKFSETAGKLVATEVRVRRP